MEMRGAAVALEGLESRLLLAYTPSTTADAVYDLVIDGINPATQPIRAASFSVGLSRTVASPTGGSADRETAAPSLSEMSLTLPSGRFSTALMQAALDGKVLTHATLVAHSPASPSVEYERWTLDNVIVTGYQTGGASGAVPVDSISVSYTKVGFQVTPHDTADQALTPAVTGYDLAGGKLVGDIPGYGGQFYAPPPDLVLEFAGGQIPISSFSWGMVHDDTSTPGNSAQVADFSFEAAGGIHSPALFANTAAGEGEGAVLTTRDTAGRVSSRWVLGNALLSSYSASDTGGDTAPRVESFTLNVAQFERAYYDYDAKGKLISTTQAGWDLATNKDYTTGSLDLGTGFGTFDAVSPDPRNAAVGALTLRFADRLAGNASPPLENFALFRDGRPIPLTGASIATIDGGTTWRIGGLSALTAQAGRYTFNFFAAGSGLETYTGADIVRGDTVSWVMDTSVPTIAAASAQPEAGAPLVVRVTFSDAVNGLATTDLKLTPVGSPSVSYAPAGMTWDATTRTAKFTFASTLPDGNYTVVMANDAVTNAAGSTLAAGLSLPTFLLAGDANRDRAVNFADLLVVAKNYNTAGATWAQGDFTGDGVVNFADLLILAKAYNKALPAAAPVTTTSVAPAMAPVTADAVLTGDGDTRAKPVFSTARVSKAAPKPAPAKPKAVAKPKGR